MAMSGEIINAITVSGILAAHAVEGRLRARCGPSTPSWVDRPTAFARRKEQSMTTFRAGAR